MAFRSSCRYFRHFWLAPPGQGSFFIAQSRAWAQNLTRFVTFRRVKAEL
jgi:hypothetical protein